MYYLNIRWKYIYVSDEAKHWVYPRTGTQIPSLFTGRSIESFSLGHYVAVYSSVVEHVSLFKKNLNRPMTKKKNKWPVRPAKTQISLSIRPVWSESSLSAWRNLGSLATRSAHSEGSDQTGRVPRLIWVFAGRTSHFVGVVMRRFIWCVHMAKIQAWKDSRRESSVKQAHPDEVGISIIRGDWW